jgi:hypothetical protein
MGTTHVDALLDSQSYSPVCAKLGTLQQHKSANHDSPLAPYNNKDAKLTDTFLSTLDC